MDNETRRKLEEMIDREMETAQPSKTLEDEKVKAERHLTVAKANALIQKSRYKFSLQEQRLVLYLISKIKPSDNQFTDYEFSTIDFCKVCGIDYQKNKQTHAYIKQIIENLAAKSLWIDKGDKEVLCRWINKAYIIKNDGSIRLRLDEDLMPYLLCLKEYYTSYDLINVLAMKSKYGIRLYELLKSYAYLGEKYYDIEELKKRLNAENYKYSDFKIKVLTPALEDIDNYTDIKVYFTEIKESRKVVGLYFKIEPIKDVNIRIGKWSKIEQELNEKQD